MFGTAVGGMALTTTVEGLERYPVRLRHPREMRRVLTNWLSLLFLLQQGSNTIGDVAEIEYIKGAQMIQSENTFCWICNL